MNTYPLKDINLEQWKKKVQCTSMYTIPAEDDALPVLHELEEILTRLMTLPIAQTLDESLIQYFFTHVFPTVCHKIIRSRYFKNPLVLKLSNSILQKSVYLTQKYIDIAIKYPKFLQVLTMVLTDDYYYKTNNQLVYMIYPYSYFPQSNINEIVQYKVGDFVDILKTGNLYEKVSWSQGQVIQVDEDQLQIAYLYDGNDKKIRIKKDSPQLAPYKTKSHTFQWRMGLKQGDLVDVQDSFGTWYNGTVLQAIEKNNGKKNVRVTLKVYNENGNKQDENGTFYGFTDYDQLIDVTSPKIAPYCTISKQFCYQSSKASSYDAVQDINDYQFQQINGVTIYALPRKKYLSQFQFQTINGFGQLGGFELYISYFQKESNFEMFCYFIKGISGVAPYLHRKFVKEATERLKVLFQKYLFNDKNSKNYTKQQTQMAFSGLKILQKRIYSNDDVSKYQNNLKMKLVDSCLQSQTIKNKLQGLNQLKDIVKSVTYVSQKNKYIKQWVKTNKIFQKIYIINSHVHLIKKSEEFFKYLITQNILQVIDLQRLYKMAQKGDFQSRVALYKLFQEVSHIFKKEHVQFLIDTILESDLNLILNQDIDLLHELSRYSNYFPMEKVIKFFENIILSQNKVKELNDYAIKKYSQIVAKNSEVKPYRRNIIKTFLQKLYTNDVLQVTKVLKGIFEGIGTGEWGKKDLNQIVADEKVDEVVVESLRKTKGQPQFSKNFSIILDFLLFIYKLSYRIKINIKILENIWQLLANDQEKQKQFYRWANQINKCQQGFEGANTDQLQQFYRKLFTAQSIPNMQGSQMQLAKNFFVQINKRAKYITVSSSFKDKEIQKQYKRKVEMKLLKLIDLLILMVYQIKSESINNIVLNFFKQLYTSKDNSQQQIDQFLSKLLKDFKQQYQSKSYSMLVQTIKLMQVVINDSQKNVQANIKSLISKKQSDVAKFIIINEISYISSESFKKTDMILSMNIPVIKLRKILGKQFNLSWQQVKIVSNKEIQDYDNSRTLKQIKLNPNQPLTISRRILPSQTQQQLILNDQVNPKAIRCFQLIFDKYSTDGKMDKNQCNSFTAMCLGSSCSQKYYKQKISSLYSKYDDDNDGLLTFQNFYRFYQDAAKDRPSTVWSNLRSFGVRGDFRFNDEPNQNTEVTRYPRNIIAEQNNVYDILFDLLHVKEVAQVAFQLLERLPVSKNIEQQLLHVQTQQDLSKILTTSDLYELFYKLNIIQYLAHSNELQEPNERQWQNKFINLQGYQQLYNCLKRITQNKRKLQQQQSQGKQKQRENKQATKQIIRQIQQAALNMLNQYWIQCFAKNPSKVRLSLAFISADEDIDDKMDFLIFGKILKSDKKIQAKASKIKVQQGKLCIWKGKSKQQMKKILLIQLRNKWTQLCQLSNKRNNSTNNNSNEQIYSLTMLINKIIDSINIIYMNENPQELTNLISTLLDTIPSQDLIRRLYCLILSQCFFVTDTNHYSSIMSKQNGNKYQGIYIKQMFKNLTKGTITSEHFRVLAVLVSKFGIQSASASQMENQNQQSVQTTSQLKQVLFDNVLHNNNQLTVQGCAKLLANFSMEGITYDKFEQIWTQKLFNPNTICQKQQTKIALYQLILKICDNNPNLVEKIIKKVIQTLQKQIKNMKIVYCNEFKQRSSTGYAGLKNLGSTCYINSMIQQLYMNKNFRYCILRADDGQKQNLIQVIGSKDQVRQVDDNFLHQLQKIFANLQNTNRIDFAPKDFCVAYKPFGESVNVLIQQDVQQFVSMFFDRLQAGLANTPFKKLVQDFYSGKTVNLFKCHSCQKTKKVQQNFHSISLEVKTSKTLAQSFNRFGLGEMISDYKCEFCEKKVDVTKKTRISKAPKILIIHLQRIVFNYDTFINQKITSKHSFPQNFNLYETTLQYYEKSEAGDTQLSEPPKQYQYNLIGIIIHTGTAESGHYISYIKTNQNKWIQFNDSQVTPFNPSNIQSQCFGGYFATSAFDDDYFEEKKQSSKSAYLLIYEKQGANTIQLMLNDKLQSCKSQKQRQQLKQHILNTLQLKQVIMKVNQNLQKQKVQNTQQPQKQQISQTQNSDKNTPNMTESHQQSSSAPQDSQKQTKQTKQLLQQKQLEIRRHLSEDNIETDPTKIKQQQSSQSQSQNNQQSKSTSKDIIVYVKDPVSAYIPQSLKQQIKLDNEIHYFEKCLSSSSFAKFFSTLISKSNGLYESILPVCQKLTFGFWLKSPSFKDLLNMLDGILKVYPQGFQTVITNNPSIINLLIQTSDNDIRSAMASFLSRVVGDTIQNNNISIREHPDHPIYKFLDKLFSLLPSTVSKCWIKFGQYFQFWYELSNKGQLLVEYMIDREIIKHFMDYFLDTKSPLKIYATKRQHQIGSSYTNPNFSMLLKCVFSLLQQRMIFNEKLNKPLSLSQDQQLLLTSYESLQKLISENHENIAAQLVKQICPNNLSASQKAAIVLLKGISKSNTDSIQPYMQVLHQFILIQDEYQDLRIKWVVGKQTLAVSAQSMKITALNSYSLDERIHNFDSSIYIESGSSLLQPILAYYKRIQNFALIMVKEVLKLCDESNKLRKYIFSLQSPTLLTQKYVDFFKGFIDKYVQDSKRSNYSYYSSSSSGFNKEQFGKHVKELYEKILKKVQEDLNIQNDKSKQVNNQQNIQEKREIKQNNVQTQMTVNNQQSNEILQQREKKIGHTQNKQEIKDQQQQQNRDQKNNADKDKSKDEQTNPTTQLQQIPRTIQKQKSSQTQKQTQNVQIINGIDYYGVNYEEDDDDWNKLPIHEVVTQQRQTYELQYGKKTQGRQGRSGRNNNNNSSNKNSSNKNKVSQTIQQQQQYKIKVVNQKDSEKKRYTNDDISYSDEQSEPLMKTKQKQKNKTNQKQKDDKQYKQVWHPVKFQYTPIRTLQLTQKFTNVRIEQHQSTVTYVLTKPIGYSNKSFISMGGIQRTSQRLSSEVWKTSKEKKVHGFYVKNSSKQNIRIQTNDGCMYCKAGENLFIWADQLVRVWESQKSIDWPKWKMHPINNSNINGLVPKATESKVNKQDSIHGEKMKDE